MTSRGVPLSRTAGLAAAVGIGLALLCAGGAAASPPGEMFGQFSPEAVAPGDWQSIGPDAPGPEFAGCSGPIRGWKRSDGVRFGLVWEHCDDAGARTYSKSIAVARVENGAAWIDRGVLHGADVVQPLADRTGAVRAIARSWVEAGYIVLITVICGPLAIDECAALSGDAAVFLSARLPGEPMSSSGLPSGSAVIGALLVTWGMIVGGSALNEATRRPRYLVVSDRRVWPVDDQAREIRRRHRGRRWGQAFLGAGLVDIGVAAVVAVRMGQLLVLIPAGACAALLVAVGVTLVVLYRRPAGRPNLPRSRNVAFFLRPRRLLSLLVTAVVAIFTVSVPVLAVLGVFVLGLVSDDDEVARLAAGGLLIALALGWLLDRGAQRLRARDAAEAMRSDRRGYFLYLRYFGDDDLRVTASGLGRRGLYQVLTGWASVFRRNRFEEIFTRAVATFGPVIAVDPPDLRLRRLMSVVRVSKLGAHKTRLPMDDWQATVEQMATEASAVIMAASPSAVGHGLRWEMQMVAERLVHGRVILLIGPHKTRPATISSFNRFMSEVDQYPMFQPLSEELVPDGTLVLVHVPNEGWGTWYGCGARQRTAWTYTAAIDEALAFARTAWSRPTAIADPFHGVEVSETVQLAFNTLARSMPPAVPISTLDLLVTLSNVDVRGRWDRVWLQAAGHQHNGFVDPAARPVQWRGVQINRTCEQALATAARIGRRFDLRPLPPGVVALGLISDPRSAAARALGVGSPEQHHALRSLIELELIGSSLEPDRPAANALPAGGAPVALPPATPAPPARVVAATGNRPLSLRYRIWSVIALSLLGYGLWHLGREEGPSAVLIGNAVYSIIGFVIFYASAMSSGSGRRAMKVAVVGTALSLGEGLVIALLLWR